MSITGNFRALFADKIREADMVRRTVFNGKWTGGKTRPMRFF